MYTLIHGNCLEHLTQIDDTSVDLTVTSPPYDDLRTYNDSLAWNQAIWQQIIAHLYRVTKPGGVVVWVVGDATTKGSETGTSFRQALYAKECGFNLHDTMIYQKNSSPYPDHTRYYQCFEYMFVLSKGRPKTVLQITDRRNRCYGTRISGTERMTDGSLRDRSQTAKGRTVKLFGVRWNIWKYSTGLNCSYSEKFVSDHPAVFPEKLIRDHILSWSEKNDIVLDPFTGSGITGKMAVLHNRNFIGIEIVETYYHIAKRRLADADQSMKTSAA